jgi:hypothetical protein
VPTRRHWNVGIVSSDDVRELQSKIRSYQSDLQHSIDAAAQEGKPLDYHPGPRSIVAWGDLSGRVETYVDESPSTLFAGSQYDCGRGLITEQDGWRDYLASQRGGIGPAPDVPSPVPVPAADVSVFGGIGMVVFAVLGIMVLREFR